MKRKLSGAETPTFQKPVPMPPIKPAKETSTITNYDRIISKSIEELASWLNGSVAPCPMPTFLAQYCPFDNDYDCDMCWLEWLKQEAQE